MSDLPLDPNGLVRMDAFDADEPASWTPLGDRPGALPEADDGRLEGLLQRALSGAGEADEALLPADPHPFDDAHGAGDAGPWPGGDGEEAAFEEPDHDIDVGDAHEPLHDDAAKPDPSDYGDDPDLPWDSDS